MNLGINTVFEGDKMDKKLLFMLKDEKIMIHAIYNVEEEKMYFKNLDEEEDYQDLENIDKIKECYFNIYEEDEEMLGFLIDKIKDDDSLIDKIKSNSSDKLLFVYEYIKQEGF
jgi:hypothetical protein